LQADLPHAFFVAKVCNQKDQAAMVHHFEKDKLPFFAFGAKCGSPAITASSSLPLNKSGINNEPNATLPHQDLVLIRISAIHVQTCVL
jgi:hypothetical protein